jgi:hypothetical protein
MTSDDMNKINRILTALNLDERKALFQLLRPDLPIHPLEKKWSTTAEVILEAIERSGDLTQRGVRGLIAEASFKEHVVNPLVEAGWQEKAIVGNKPYDFLLEDEVGEVRVQVKMQRRKQHRPMLAVEANKSMFPNASDMWVVETQRTRGGKDSRGEATRPYKFGEFDVIAVSLHPSTNDWSTFRFAVATRLIPDPKNSSAYSSTNQSRQFRTTTGQITLSSVFLGFGVGLGSA